MDLPIELEKMSLGVVEGAVISYLEDNVPVASGETRVKPPIIVQKYQTLNTQLFSDIALDIHFEFSNEATIWTRVQSFALAAGVEQIVQNRVFGKWFRMVVEETILVPGTVYRTTTYGSFAHNIDPVIPPVIDTTTLVATTSNVQITEAPADQWNVNVGMKDGNQTVILNNLPSVASVGVGAVAVGHGAASLSPGQEDGSVAIGYYAGEDNQKTNAVAVGREAGRIMQQSGSVAVGYLAGRDTQEVGAVAVGQGAGNDAQGAYSVAIGFEAGNSDQDISSVAIGVSAGNATQSTFCVAVGANAGQTSQQTNCVAIGYQAGQTNQSVDSVAVGSGAGKTSQGFNSVAVGNNAGTSLQNNYCVAVGEGAGELSQGANSVALGNLAGYDSQLQYAVAIGNLAGNTNQSSYSVAIGAEAAFTTQSGGCVAVGHKAGYQNQSADSVAVGLGAGREYQGAQCVAIGFEAAKGIDAISFQGAGSICLGYRAGTDGAGVGVAVPAKAVCIGENCIAPTTVGRLAFGNAMEALTTASSVTPLPVSSLLNLNWNGTSYRLPILAATATNIVATALTIPIGMIHQTASVDSPFAISLAVGGTWYAIDPVDTLKTNASTVGAVNFFSNPVTGRLTYDGTETQYFVIHMTISCASDTVGDDFHIRLTKNGSDISGGRLRINFTSTGATENFNFNISCSEFFAQNDYLQAQMRHTTGGATIQISAFRLMMVGSIGK